MKPTKEQCMEWARSTGTPYVNRHYPGITTFGFTEETLQALVLRAYTEGQKDMRERAIQACRDEICSVDGQLCADAVRALPVEGEI